METNRQKKVGQLLQEEIGEIIRKLTQNSGQSILLTVTKVRPSSDLSVAKVYVSIFPSNLANTIVDEINQSKSIIRKELGNSLSKHLRIIPDLSFYIDDSLDYIESIEKELRGEGDNPTL